MKKSTSMFLEGSTSEKEFYCVRKENLITLREYLKMLREKERKFKYYAKEEINIVKSNLKWIKDIKFDGVQDEKTGGFLSTTIHLITKENEDYSVTYNQDTKQYEPLANKIPKLYYLIPKVRRFSNRMNELYKIQPELRSIEHWGRVSYNKCLFTRNSVSGHFTINYVPQYSFLVNNEYESLIAFYEEKNKNQDKPLLTGESAERALDLIQIEAKNLPNLNEPSTAAVYIFGDSNKVKKMKYTINENNNEED